MNWDAISGIAEMVGAVMHIGRIANPRSTLTARGSDLLRLQNCPGVNVQ